MFIDDHDLIIAHDIVDILMIDDSCLECILDMVYIVIMLAHIDILDSEDLLEFLYSSFRQSRCLLFLIDLVVCIFLEASCDRSESWVFRGRFAVWGRYDERSTGFIDED